MKHYEITIKNGSYPLTYQCSTIAEAFGCLMEVSSWASHVQFDPDEMMGVLVNMSRGQGISFESYGFRVAVQEGEV